ncbi:hypothetical protein PFAG_06029, partial [Plasmodium falciparum Santa Lucia]
MAASTTYSSAKNAKELLDMIGKDVHETVKKEAQKRSNGDLKGFLTGTTIFGGKKTITLDPCQLESEYTELIKTKNNRYPCGNRTGKEERFSDTLGGQCTYNRIKDSNKNDNKGACAPYRRLHLCDYNLESISDYNSSNARHNLLAEVCLAAKYEGNSINTPYPKHKETNNDSASQLCTVLARSFADIGDIVRGRDLYLGDKGEKKKLQDNLKEIFGKIHNGLDGKIKSKYNGDTDNYYELREDWWTENRHTVWKAITCNVHGSDYFRPTCGGGQNKTKNNCRCGDDKKPDDQVPTYFDYVPQYLRWFEEWAEDFCRKKKKKLENLEQQCRGEGGKERYCSGNGYDCEKTIYKKGKLVISSECTKCSVWCRMYETWIDNQKKEFLKQKRKYKSEMQKYTNGAVGNVTGRKKRGAPSNINYEGYEKKFYDILKNNGNYGTVDNFLEKLNEEDVCKKITDEKEIINFKTDDNDFHKNINNKGTFYHSEYCEVCPGCGMKKTKDGKEKWEQKNGGTCTREKRYKILDYNNFNGIDVLSFGDKRQDIEKKLEEFCPKTNGDTTNSVHGSGDCGGGNSDSSLCEKWQCYKYEYVEEVVQDDDDPVNPDYVKYAGGLCILKNEKYESEKETPDEPAEFQKTFNEFFYFWIRRFLNDSMYWRGKVNSCINKSKREKCKEECKKECDCFLKWIEQKRKEWEKIKVHFNTQEGIPDGFTHDALLITVLNIDELFKDIKDGYGNAKELEGIKNMLDEEKKREAAGILAGGENNTTIDKLLKHEGDDAKGCIDTHKEKCKEQKKTSRADGGPGVARSESADDNVPPASADLHDDDEDDDDEEEEEEEIDGEGGQDDVVENQVEVKGPKEPTLPPATTTPEVTPACDIVDKLFTTTETLKEACPTKYGKTAPTSWKCIPSGNTSETTIKSGDTTGGSICVPPRRRKLYIKKIVDWAEKQSSQSQASESSQGTTEASVSQETSGGQKTPVSGGDTPSQTAVGGQTTSPPPSDPRADGLREAFIQSAAVETFFSWHEFKKEKEKEIREKNEMDGRNLLFGQDDTSDDPDNPQSKLKNGVIPEEFKRQMFYTLGDYRDILFGKDVSSVKDMDKIENIIKGVFQDNGSKTTIEKQREKWWKNYGPHIWEGMLCALSYDTDTKEMNNQLREKLMGDSKNKENAYERISFKGGFNSDKSATISTTTTKLDTFVKRPTFFRWLEEWAQEFCKKRTHKLAQIKHECRRQDGTRYCDGDGFDCKNLVPNENGIFEDFNCPSCANSCTSYKKWLSRKEYEFNKQKEKYQNKIDDAQKISHNTSDENFIRTFSEDYKSIHSFLENLKGPCFNYNSEDKINFNNTEKTFGPAINCAPCPLFGENCIKKDCSHAPMKICNGKTFNTADDIKTIKRNTEQIDILVTDNIKNGFPDNLKNSCHNSDIFEDIRIYKWTCGDVCGLDICDLESPNEKKVDKQNILIRTLFKHWVENFLKDYNKINDKISHCINNGKGSICINGCKENCECVYEWIKIKKIEWEKVRDRYFKQYSIKGSHKSFTVKSFMESLLPQIDVENIKGKVKKLSDLYDSNECIDTDTSKKGQHEYNDVVECLLDKLKNKIGHCKAQYGTKIQSTCDESPPNTLTDEILDEDKDTPTNTKPQFCPKDVEDTKEAEPDFNIFCDSKKQPKCNNLENDLRSTCKPKVKLIGLGAHNLIARTNSNVYMSPRVRQLCLEQLTKLAVPTKNADLVTEEQFSEALQECAYNEAKSLYEYYKGEGKGMIPIKDNEKIEDKIKEHILEAMKRSYADYGNIVKGDMWWIYPDEKDVDTVIISVANKFNVNHKSSVSIDDDAKRLNLWKSLRNDIWKAMLCGYQKGKNNNAQIDKNWCTVPTDDETDQFLRWFVEWGHNFCIRREQELKRLKEKCHNVICNGTGENEKQECKRLCENYKQFLKMYENQYKQQSIQYRELESSIDEFKDKDPFTFLKEKCNAGFSCFKDVNENEHNKIFQYPSDEVKNLCTCTSTDTSKTTPTNCIEKAAYELKKEAMNKIGNVSNSLKSKGNENDISFKDCRRGDYVVVENGAVPKKIDKDKLEIEFPSSIYSCETNGINNVHIGKEWDCNYRNINFREKNLCLPPRRQFMCIKNIKDIQSENIKDKNELLNEVIKTAKNEGVRILKNYQEQNKTDFSYICDDMKYSFADLGDIIRGRDLWKKYRGERRLQQKLETIFNKIYNNLENGKQIYTYDNPYYYNLRNDWWNENREAIWKAMTCCAPRDAYINKTTENSEKTIRSTDMYNYCGHNHNPPYDDYIPQRLRWMKEWGEYVCKILNEKIDDMKKDCEQCTLNNSRCRDDDDGNKCRKCKSKCKEYTELIQNLKLQFSIQKQKYNELYTKIQNNRRGFTKDNDKYVIEFFEKVKKINTCNVDTADKYLDKASHCKHYKFTQNKIKTTPYIFNEQPEMYKSHCVCTITNHPLDNCPFRNENKGLCNTLKELSECKNKTFDNKLDSWGTHDLKYRTSTNQGVFIPPRRTRLCLKPLIKRNYAQHDEHNFLNDLLTAAYTEAYALGDKFKNQPTEALQAMKNSFADYGDIIKGTDMIDNMYLNELKTQLETIIKYNGTSTKTKTCKKWWEYNKNKVWHAMLCGYQKGSKVGIVPYNWCSLPEEDKTDQFLRWFQEWTQAFCSRRNELYKALEAQNTNTACVDGRIYPDSFKNACEKYRNFIANKKIQYDLQMYQYNKKYKNSKSYSKEGPDFVRNKCNGKCECLSGKFIENSKLENPYETMDETLKSKCDCEKTDSPKPLPPAEEPFDPTILQTTIPFGIALALGSIAFLFMKKKTKSSVGNLFQILHIPKSDYDIPTLKSSNRYIPYASDRYKGKTYIYMEGDTSGDEKYAFMSDTTDITSSESEYEELDINDIYVP